ncbi:MAG: carboxymuconolactone decarboxylase family protein [Devosia sp.]
MKRIVHFAAALAVSSVLAGPLPALAEDMTYEQALADIEATLGFVPDFFHQQPKAGFAGAWLQLKALEFSGDTALTAKVKTLIELAVVSQIPCSYCIWADTEAARALGATEEEIAEAVAVAATGRYWSTMLNGRQSDFEAFKQDFTKLLGQE